ncbi:MAG: PfkB family carbohydrate kinase [Nitrospinaceae bacterium]
MPTTPEKILSLEKLACKAEEMRKLGRRVILCHGTFDLLHIGHIRHLQNARKEGDVLFTTITGDRFVNKGPERPVFPEHLRSENLAALACVDFVAINQAPTAVNVISMIRPHAYVKGKDYKNTGDDLTGNIIREKEAVEQYGGELIFTEDITFSSSNLLNENFGIFPPETKVYLKNFRQRYKDSNLIQMLKTLSRLRVIVVGDAIIDEYHYTTLLGQSGKGAHQSVQYNSREQFAGGALAVANHLSGFVESVTLLTGLGTGDNHESFIRSKLNQNITPHFHYFEDAPTIVKRRFVDDDLNKLFEVYIYNEQPTIKKLDREICSWLEKNTRDFDIVFVPDFGNGFISPGMIKTMCEKARFLVVNTQVNSGNRGYHVINRYPRADFVSLNGPELRMATHNRYDPLEGLAETVAEKLNTPFFAATLGSKGAFLLDRKEDAIHKIPVLSTKVLDRVGAGDAFLSLTGLCLGGGLPSDMGLFVGSAAAALDVQIVCNREPVAPTDLYKYITTLLK